MEKTFALNITPVELNAIVIGLNSTGWKRGDFKVIEGLVAKITILAEEVGKDGPKEVK